VGRLWAIPCHNNNNNGDGRIHQEWMTQGEFTSDETNTRCTLVSVSEWVSELYDSETPYPDFTRNQVIFLPLVDRLNHSNRRHTTTGQPFTFNTYEYFAANRAQAILGPANRRLEPAALVYIASSPSYVVYDSSVCLCVCICLERTRERESSRPVLSDYASRCGVNREGWVGEDGSR